MISLKNKVVLVTGGSRGIGAAVSLLLAEAGADVSLTFASDRRSAEIVAKKIRARGRRCITIKANASSARQARSAVRKTYKQLGRIDILVNNAGIWTWGEIGTMTEKIWDETLDVNLKGTFLYCNEVVPLMKKQGGGKIINIASTAGQRGEAFHSHYAASKAGMIGFTKAIGTELAPHNIIVNCVAPGWVDTAMSAEPLHNPKDREAITKAIPRGKIATPDDIAGSVLFLASDFSNHLVGSVISVNGGSVLAG